MNALDLYQYCLPPTESPTKMSSKKPPRHKQNELFIKGPIPVNWFKTAMQKSTAAVRVGVVLWFLAGITTSREVKPTWQHYRLFGFSEQVAYRGLKDLESAGLITVKRHRGRCPVVTVLKAQVTRE